MNINSFGVLYVVATPIGNLQDITFRAVEILKTVNGIVAEDTRRSQALLQAFSIHTKMAALHDHNERDRVASLLDRLRQGESIALISDAGTPLISDPGYHLVNEVRLAGISVVPIPGPCAAIAALSVAGLPTDRFVFEGFLPAKAGARAERLAALGREARTMVFYEAPHRIVDLLGAMVVAFGGERRAVLARELTKIFETIKAGTLAELVDWVTSDVNQQRGEIVVLVQGLQDEPITDQAIESVLVPLLEELPLKQAVVLAAKILNKKKNDVYDAALRMKNNPAKKLPPKS